MGSTDLPSRQINDSLTKSMLSNIELVIRPAEDFERKLKGSVEAGFLWMRFEVGKAVVSCAVL